MSAKCCLHKKCRPAFKENMPIQHIMRATQVRPPNALKCQSFFTRKLKSASLLYTFVHFSTLNLKKGAISYNTHTELLESLTLCIFTYAIKILLPPCCAILQGVVVQFCISFEKNMHCQGCSVE